MGPVLAIGMVVTVLAGVTLLPATLAALGTAPKKSKPSTLWPRIGKLVEKRPAALTVAVLAILVAGALGNLKDSGTLDFSEQFRTAPESVQGLERLQQKFPPGQAGPVDVLFSATAVAEALPGMNAAPAVASTDLNGFSKDGSLALVRITSSEDPFTEQAADTIPEIRELARRYDPNALVGGPTAEIRDSTDGLANDARKIVPIALALIFLIVAALLRSLIAPLYVIGTTILSFAFALGVSRAIFPESDPALPLFTFVFLVALGVDYNIFLIARIREEKDVITGLEKTGGVITSAGLILAGTFCTLLATELESLFQVGFIVALGLLVDTFLIRVFLVPSIALLLGSRSI
jgi:RND superfamily putative drug exporter